MLCLSIHRTSRTTTPTPPESIDRASLRLMEKEYRCWSEAYITRTGPQPSKATPSRSDRHVALLDFPEPKRSNLTPELTTLCQAKLCGENRALPNRPDGHSTSVLPPPRMNWW